VLEERDVQIRGYKIRLPLDVIVVASANPEDYTNRGRIITPLKDRFGSQIRTHYPLDVETEVAIARQEAQSFDVDGRPVDVPDFMAEIVATFSATSPARAPTSRSGPACRCGSRSRTSRRSWSPTPRVAPCACRARPRSCRGCATSTPFPPPPPARSRSRRSRRGATQIVEHLSAILSTFRDRLAIEKLRPVIEAFEGERVVHAGDDVVSSDYVALVEDIAPLRDPVTQLIGAKESPAAVASAVEFVLEGLHLSKRLNKEAVGCRSRRRARGSR
jgi:magnesium chelatase subunit I